MGVNDTRGLANSSVLLSFLNALVTAHRSRQPLSGATVGASLLRRCAKSVEMQDLASPHIQTCGSSTECLHGQDDDRSQIRSNPTTQNGKEGGALLKIV
ncbi:hypothetical protein JZ751_001007 [Albula glossodonta]|uniref:Uncharacterized protein n=1 Tax=Albula glossodonta TaxID=121402 RepID=A0A8T2PXX0_9TELE|nr:hypothetical protein JZ751_001007 [Albula glossodonta]